MLLLPLTTQPSKQIIKSTNSLQKGQLCGGGNWDEKDAGVDDFLNFSCETLPPSPSSTTNSGRSSFVVGAFVVIVVKDLWVNVRSVMEIARLMQKAHVVQAKEKKNR